MIALRGQVSQCGTNIRLQGFPHPPDRTRRVWSILVTFLASTAPRRLLTTSGGGAVGTAQRLAAAALRPASLSLGRAGVGGVMLLSPRALTGFLGVPPSTAGATSWAVQMLGAREIALGLGAFTALRRGDAGAARLWLAAGLLCDSLDAVVVAAAVGRGRVSPAPGAVVVASATTAAAVQAAALAGP